MAGGGEEGNRIGNREEDRHSAWKGGGLSTLVDDLPSATERAAAPLQTCRGHPQTSVVSQSGNSERSSREADRGRVAERQSSREAE